MRLPNRPVSLSVSLSVLPHARSAVALLLALLALLASLPAAASKPANITQGEVALLPPYCIDTMGFGYGDAYHNTSPRAGHWVAMLGAKSFWSLHHYCWALVDLRRAKLPAQKMEVRRGTLERAYGNCVYVLEHGARDLILLPEIYTRMGEISLLLGNIGAASEAYGRARELKPDYWPAYSQWASVLIKTGQKAAALELVRAGLAQAPDAEALREQYRQLGGNPAEFARAAAPAAAASAPAEAAASAPIGAAPASSPASAASEAAGQ